jgi:peptidoglycan/xylan/chitin deacetylase (PgdA/CDA1 family)
MLNYDRKKNKIITKKTIAIAVCLIVIASLSAVFVIYNKIQTGGNNGKVASSRINREKLRKIMDKRESVPPKESKIAQTGDVSPYNVKRTDGKKVAYLTFDDGPSLNTTKILQILNQNNIKANFFLIGRNAERYPDLVKMEVADGEIVGNHTYSHELDYKEGPDNFVKDLDKCNDVLESILGDKYDAKLVRFPGGSFDPIKEPGKLAPFRDAVTKAGYRYINWNDETGDADSFNPPVPVLFNNLKKYTQGKSVVVILMHDAAVKTNSVQVLPQVIQYLKSQNFTFDTIE